MPQVAHYTMAAPIELICSWIPRNMSVSNAKIVYDDYGFKLENFVQTMPLGYDSFAFPI